MAVQTLKVVVCDQCGTDEPTERYTVTFPTGRRRTFDLCAGCSGPLAELSQLVAANGRGPKGHAQPVLSPEAVESKLRKARKKPQNRT